LGEPAAGADPPRVAADTHAPPTRPDDGLKGSRMDLVCLALVGVFFALSWGLVVLCERL
jgi:hypothetical protein